MDFSKITDYFTQTSYSDYPYTDYRRYQAIISNTCEQAYSVFPDIHSLNQVPSFLWSNKEWIISGVAIGIITLQTIKYFRNRPQYPIVNMQSSLDHARVSIEVPKQKILPPKATLTFCVDTSGSMKDKREEEVKKGIDLVLDNALEVIQQTKGAEIEVAIVGFNDNAYLICPPTKIISKTIEKIKKSLNNYKSSGSTAILAGLNEATSKLEGMANKNKGRVHTLILLTDGGENLIKSNVQPIHTRLTKVNAKLFAVGIGDHNKLILNMIASKKENYIDTTGNQTIIDAISHIYNQTIANFSDLELKSPQLKPETWSINDISADEQSKCWLGTLSKEKKIAKTIQIHSKRLESPLDLSKIVFELTFTDSKGKKGRLFLPWKPNPIINPQILNHNYTQETSKVDNFK